MNKKIFYCVNNNLKHYIRKITAYIIVNITLKTRSGRRLVLSFVKFVSYLVIFFVGNI